MHRAALIVVAPSSGLCTSSPRAPGKVLGDPMEIPGYGQYVFFFDTEGNRVSMMQPDERYRSN
jgi:hypothetical protein